MVGRPFFLNYYVIFDTQQNYIAIVETTYTDKLGGMKLSAIVFILILSLVLVVGIIGCVLVYRRNKAERQLLLERTYKKIEEIENKSVL